MRLPVPTLCVILPFLIPVSTNPIPLPDNYVVGIFPSLDIIFNGFVASVKQWLGVLIPTLLSGGSLQQVLGTLFPFFNNVETDVDPGVEDLTDTLKEPVTSID